MSNVLAFPEQGRAEAPPAPPPATAEEVAAAMAAIARAAAELEGIDFETLRYRLIVGASLEADAEPDNNADAGAQRRLTASTAFAGAAAFRCLAFATLNLFALQGGGKR